MNVNFLDICCVYLVFLTRFKNKAAGVVGLSGVVGAPVFSTYLLGFLPGAEDSSHKPKTSCWFHKAAKLVFFYFLKLIQAMCELVICMSGMHLFTMSSKMSPPITACLEMPLTGSGWKKRHVIEKFPTAIRSFKVLKVPWIFFSSLCL